MTIPRGKLHFESGNATLGYAKEGTGPLVILLHGITATSGMWKKAGVIQRLSRHFTVAALDVRGHGASTKSGDPNFYGLEMIEDGVRFLDHLGMESAHWVGYSMGSTLALKIASLYPERVDSLVLGGLGYREPTAWHASALKTAQSLREGSGFGEFFSFIPPGHQKRVHLRKETVNAILRHNDPESIAAILEQSHELEVTEDEMRRISAPALCLSGHLDSAYERAARIVELIPDCRRIQVSGTHFSVINDPAFAGEIEKFILRQVED